jgi:hypothetical protein
MTIASCLILPEGVVFGVDSTTSAESDDGYHYLNHSQKLFEVGEDGTLAIMTWGLSYFRSTSYRTLIAYLSDEFKKSPPENVEDAANQWLKKVWDSYQGVFKEEIQEFRNLESRQMASATTVSDFRSEEDDRRYLQLKDDLHVGFCIGGYCLPSREPQAYWFEIDPSRRSPGSPNKVIEMIFKGQPSLFQRLYDGFDFQAREAIKHSPFWTGASRDLDDILDKEALVLPEMTVRDGIDFVHFSIYATIKALKFSTKGQVCGGPIELAVITTDRKFRWVRHKTWDSAVGYDGP